MKAHIEKIVYPGKSLATIGGKVIFCDEGLPGEIVEVEPFREKKAYIEARTKKILDASPHRVPVRCAHYKTCSPYQYINYPFQLEIKKSQLREIFSRSLKIELNNLLIKASPEIWGYRNKVRLHLIRENSKVHLAYHQPGAQDEFVKVKECFLISDKMNSLLSKLCETIAAKKLEGIEEVEVKESSSSKQILLILYINPKQEMDKLGTSFSELKTEFSLKGIVGLIRKKKGMKEIVLEGESFIEKKLGENIFHIGAQSFFQINDELLQEVIKDLKEMIPLTGKERIADLYCGVGTFGIALASRAKEVIGVESARENIDFLKKNLDLNRIRNFTIREGLSEEWISWILKRDVDVLILDPPRKGIDRSIIESLLHKPVPLIVYLSCNPSTLARDLKLLLSKYRLKDICIYDFFPHTPHIEICSVLARI